MLRSTLLALTLLAPAAVPLWAAGAPRPNIVFILTDDQAPWALGVSGHTDVRTPHMDRLAREGARLTASFAVTPVCSPSRGALLTSRYSTELGILDYLNPGKEPDHGLDPSLVTWPEVLARSGYAAALVGKWHLGQLDQFHPTRFGYREFTGFRVGGFISKDPTVEVGGTDRRIEGWTPDILTDFALDFIGRHRNGPFLLSLHFWAPHANTYARTPDGDRTWLPLSAEDFGRFRDLDPTIPNPDYPKLDVRRVKRMTREYLASVHSVDRNLGRILEALDRWQLAGRTMVVFTSDHGYNLGHNGIWHKGNGRWILLDNRDGHRPNLYDNSLKVPALVRWPGRVAPGTVIDRTVTHLDWFPTLLAAAGAELPEGVTIRGRDVLPLLEGGDVDRRDDLFAQYSMRHGTRADLRTYRTPQWKLVRDFYNPHRDELYHLATDPAEAHNLIRSSEPKIQSIRRELNEKLLGRMQAIGDPALPEKSTPAGPPPES